MKPSFGPGIIGLTLCLAACVGLATGCSGKPPEISRAFGRAMLVHDIQDNTYSEKLSVFVVGNDPDGMDDLANLYVINDDAELFWSLDSKSWTTATAEGESWIGTNALGMPDGSSVPGGSYRVVLEDAGGSTAEESFTLPDERADPAKTAFPTAGIKDDAIVVSAKSYSTPEVWIFAKDGRFLMRLSGDAGPLTLAAIVAAYPTLAQGFTFWAYAFDPKSEYGLLAGPYSSAGSRDR